MDLRAVASRVLRHRLVAFVVLGGVLFALSPRARGARDVDVSDDQAAAIFAAATRSKGAPLDDDERRRALDAWIDTEILAREARRLGLDLDDGVVRDRLAERLREVARASGSGGAAPTDAELRAFHAAHPERFRRKATVRFEHAFAPLADAGPTFVDGGARASPPMTDDEVRRFFGDAVAEAVARAPEGAWTSPIAAAYGHYRVRVLARADEATAPFEEARDAVRAAFEEEQARRGEVAFLARVRRGYRVRLPPVAPRAK